MRKYLLVIVCSLFLFIHPLFADDIIRGRMEITEEDTSPSVFPYQLRVSNGTLTDNLDGTASLNTAGIGVQSITAVLPLSSTGGTAPSLSLQLDNIKIGTNPSNQLTIIPTYLTTESDPIVKALTGIITSNGSTISAITDSHTNWDTAYSNRILSATAPSPLTLTIAGNTLAGSILQAGTNASGYLSVTDWNTFNNKADYSFGTHNFSGTGNITANTGTFSSLAVNGNATITGDLYVADAYVTGISGESYVLGNFGIGNSAPSAMLRVGTSPGQGLLTVLNSGNVGIGTTSPLAKLSVIGNILATTLSTTILNVTGNSSFVNITAGTWSGDTLLIAKIPTIPLGTNVSGTLPDASAPLNINANTLTSGTIPSARLQNTYTIGNFNFSTLGNVGVGNTNPLSLLQVGTYPNGALTVLGSGYVGIGTTTPGYPLDVNGNARVRGSYLYIDQWIDLLGNNMGIFNESNYPINIRSTGGLYLNALGGNVGIGTTSPAKLLDVNGTFNVTGATTTANINLGANKSLYARNHTSATASVLVSRISTDSVDRIDIGAGGRISWGPGDAAADTNLYRIKADMLGTDDSFYSAGNVGIGTTSPAQKLDIIGTMRTTDTYPLMRLNIINTAVGTLPGATLSITKDYIIDKMYAQSVGVGTTNIIFTLREMSSEGTTPLYNLSAGQTATTSLLTVTSFTGGSCPAGNLLVVDINAVNGGSTPPSFRLEIYGHEK